MKAAMRTAMPHRVLLVDDDAISLELLALLLGQDGHEVLKAEDGEQALKMLSGSGPDASPDVLLVDMQMPGVSGRELARRIKGLNGRKPLVLAMSASEVNRRQLQGFDGFLLKPLELNAFRVAVAPRPRARRTPAQTRTERPARSEQDIDSVMVGKLKKALPAKSLRQLYDACLADIRSRLPAMKAMARHAETAELRRAAHLVKGGAGMIGAARIAAIAADLESSHCRQEDALPLLNDLLEACNVLDGMLLGGALERVHDYTDS